MSIYDIEVRTIDGQSQKMDAYRGKTLLIVNVASQCGFTPQYEGLQALYEQNRDKGFAVLGFPCNQFGHQEPGSEAEIKSFCTEKYGVTFDLFSKISVKGDDIHPLYRYLTTEAGVDGAVGWNFNKFLVDRHGTVVARYASGTAPFDQPLLGRIEELLAAN